MHSSAFHQASRVKLTKMGLSFIGSSIATAAVGLLLSQVFLPSIAKPTLIVCTSLFVLTVFYFVLRVIYDSWRIRYIAFFSEGTQGATFYETFFEHLIREAHGHSSNSKYEYVIFPWIADQGHGKAKLGSLRRINHSGMIVWADQGIEVKDLVAHKVHSVLLDSISSQEGLPQHFMTIRVNHEVGGKSAGEAAVKYLEPLYKEKSVDPCIMVLTGRTSDRYSQHPTKAFCEVMRIKWGNVQISNASFDLLSSRDEARTFVYTELKNLSNRQGAGKNRLPDLIFAASDDMALGAREALRQYQEEGRLRGLCEDYFTEENGGERVPQIIGYGGTLEMFDLLRSDEEIYLLATVNSKVEEQAKNAWRALTGLLEGVRYRVPEIEMELKPRGWAYHQTH